MTKKKRIKKNPKHQVLHACRKTTEHRCGNNKKILLKSSKDKRVQPDNYHAFLKFLLAGGIECEAIEES